MATKLKTLKPRVATLGQSASVAAGASGWIARSRGTPEQRGYGTEWRRIRQRILQRDCYLCQTCVREGFMRSGNIVDHIVNKADGGAWYDEANLEVICAEHHKAKTARESAMASCG